MQLANIFPNIQQNGLKRLRFNGTFAGDGYKMYPHADIHGDQDSVWTIVVFLNDSVTEVQVFILIRVKQK